MDTTTNPNVSLAGSSTDSLTDTSSDGPGTRPDAVLRRDVQCAGLAHEHAWHTASRHGTSLGVVVYVQCAQCGALRMDLVARSPEEPPVPLSREVQGARSMHRR